MVVFRALSMVATILLIGILTLEAGEPEPPGPEGSEPHPRNRLYRRWLWHWAPRVSSDPRAAPGAPGRALNAADDRKRHAGEGERSGDDGLWVGIGPSPILGGQVGLRRNERSVNGRVRAVAVDPDNQNHWLIGAAQGGVWETFDGGRSWRPRTDDQCSLAMGAIVFGARNPATGRRIVYAGTGEASVVSSAYGGHGLLVYGDDASDQWHLQPRPRATPCPDSPFAGLAFSRLLVHPSNTVRLVAATMRPGHPAIMPAVPDWQRAHLGVITSPDGGLSWEPQSTCGLGPNVVAGGATDAVANPFSTGDVELYAGLRWEKGNSSSYGVYQQTRDRCWRRIEGPGIDDIPTAKTAVGRIEFGRTPRFPNTLYVSIADYRAQSRNGLRGLWRTDNAWDTKPVFKRVSLTGGRGGGPGNWGYCGPHPTVGVQRIGEDYEGVCHYAHSASVDPDDPDVFYGGGIGLWKARVHCPPQAPTCTADWSEISHLTNPSPRGARLRRRGIHVDQQAMAWAGRRLIVVNDGGVWSTTDGGSSWQDHNRGLSVVQFYGATVADHDGRLFILGGAQDNGSFRWTGSAWEFIRGGDAGRPVVSSQHPETHWGLTYTSIVEGRTIQRTRDAGEEFMAADSPIPPSYRDLYFPGGPLIACAPPGSSGASDLVVAGAGPDLWTNRAFFTSATSPTWDRIRVDVESWVIRSLAMDPPGCEALALVIAQKLSPTQTRYDVRVTAALSQTADLCFECFQQVARFSSPIGGLAFDPGTDRMYVVVSGLVDPGAIRIDNVFGRSGPPRIVPLNTGFPAPHNALALAPDRSDGSRMHVWIGTDMGVLHGHCHRTSTTAPCRWTHHGSERGMPNVTVTDIQVSRAGQVAAFTYGRGAFLFVEGDGWCDGKHVPGVGTNFGSCASPR